VEKKPFASAAPHVNSWYLFLHDNASWIEFRLASLGAVDLLETVFYVYKIDTNRTVRLGLSKKSNNSQINGSVSRAMAGRSHESYYFSTRWNTNGPNIPSFHYSSSLLFPVYNYGTNQFVA
jgi:hypothetical protein